MAKSIGLLACCAVLLSCGSQGRHVSRPRPEAKFVVRAVRSTATTSTALQSVYVPDVAGEGEAKARSDLAAAGLAVSVARHASPSVPQGQVIGTSPSVSTFVQQGGAVKLLISTGPAQVRVPALIGHQAASAEETLAGAGLAVVVTQQPGAAQVGMVIEQSPSGGTTVAPGSIARITVATPMSIATVPNVVAETEEAAVASLSKIGLWIVFHTKTVHLLDLDRVVVAQSAAPGSRVSVGSKMTLTVGLFRPRSYGPLPAPLNR